MMQIRAGSPPAAGAGSSVTLLRADALDGSRGDVIAVAASPPPLADELTVTVCWLSDRPLRAGARVLVKHATRTEPAIVTSLLDRFDEQRLSTVDGPGSLVLNDIGRIALRAASPLPADDYTASRRTGSLLLIDPASGVTLAAGLVGGPLPVPADGGACTEASSPGQ